MIGDIILAIFILILYANVRLWLGWKENKKDIDDLSTRYFILKDKTRDLETRIRFLETEGENKKARQALPEAESESCEI